MPELTALGWGTLGLAALVIGLSKAALPGAGTVAVALFAAVLPAKQSTGTILLLLIVGDMFALWAYRRHADLRALVRLIPAVVAGLLVGVVFLSFAGDDLVRRVIGVLLLGVVGVTLWRRRATPAGDPRPHPIAAAVYGTLGGFTTMVANAAGPVMSMYFLSMRFPVKAFLGTAAWFFAVVNITKVPFAVGLGLITPPGLLIVAVLVPVVVAGALIGRRIATRIPQQLFERLVIAVTVLGAVYLLLPF
ncbi:sulfite exporter TauE/SafE family protein [Microbacterium caowuchunii]|uniref:Probable membrane transporter protein n=1 Tax=Microbacterium caowuchunii TaxID=2614638 RepID=A0A5N0TAV4_9MICO|nr:sulfite exporter TauE/SafE family protein [Microbacterium caowuchunii]KAA9132203.1 sulfite exporter TauE/SafE family protein [Microbacterium caowuchunii]